MEKETENKISQLQSLEQNLQNILQQKQLVQTQKIEVENAIGEIEKTKGDVYKVVGPLMIKGEKEKIKSDLNSKKEILDLRIKSVEKQETNFKEKMTKLQQEVVEEMKKEKGGKK